MRMRSSMYFMQYLKKMICMERSIKLSMAPRATVKVTEPTGRRGLCCAVHSESLYLYGGYESDWRLPQKRNELDVFDLSVYKWTKTMTHGEVPEAFSGCSCTVMKGCLYIFGGWHNGKRTADVHELNLSSNSWKKLTDANVKDSPMCKDKAGMVDYEEEVLCIMGGYGYPESKGVAQRGATYHWDPVSNNDFCWTNELHLFHVEPREWTSPEVSGTCPKPCAAFTFNRVDRHRVILFGGRQEHGRTDQLHILDMSNWHWNMIIPAGPDSPWPTERSFHTACPLVDPDSIHPSAQKDSHHHSNRFLQLPDVPSAAPDKSSLGGEVMIDPKLLVLWGTDNDSNPVTDSWILNVTTCTWKKLSLPASAGPSRLGHVTGSFYLGPYQAVVLAAGGTDMNLSKTEESRIKNVEKTVLLNFGLNESLFQLTLQFIASRLDTFSPLLGRIPLKLQEAVHSEHSIMMNKGMYYHGTS